MSKWVVWIGLIGTLASSASGCAAVASVDGVPDRALHYLEKQYPAADFVEWSSWEDEHTVSFYDAKAERSTEIVFDKRGRWQEITTTVEPSQLPTAIQHYMTDNFAEYYATAYHLRYPTSERYGVILDTPTHIYTLYFSPQGSLISRSEEGLDGN